MCNILMLPVLDAYGLVCFGGVCRHRVVVGRIYPESVNMNEDLFLERVFGFMLVSHSLSFCIPGQIIWCRCLYSEVDNVLLVEW